jgi:hypothetical protein
MSVRLTVCADDGNYLCVNADESLAWLTFIWSHFGRRTKAVVDHTLYDLFPDTSDILQLGKQHPLISG